MTDNQSFIASVAFSSPSIHKEKEKRNFNTFSLTLALQNCNLALHAEQRKTFHSDWFLSAQKCSKSLPAPKSKFGLPQFPAEELALQWLSGSTLSTLSTCLPSWFRKSASIRELGFPSQSIFLQLWLPQTFQDYSIHLFSVTILSSVTNAFIQHQTRCVGMLDQPIISSPLVYNLQRRQFSIKANRIPLCQFKIWALILLLNLCYC